MHLVFWIAFYVSIQWNQLLPLHRAPHRDVLSETSPTSKRPLPSLCSDISADLPALSWKIKWRWPWHFHEQSGRRTPSSVPAPRSQGFRLLTFDFRKKVYLRFTCLPPLELSRIVAAKGLIWTKALHTEGAVPRELSFRWLPHSGIAQVCLKFQVQGNFCPFSFWYATNYGVALTNVEGSVLKVKSCNSRRRYQGRTWISYTSTTFFFLKYSAVFLALLNIGQWKMRCSYWKIFDSVSSDVNLISSHQ